MTHEHHKWYVLNAEGRTIREVIVGGPYLSFKEADDHWAAHKPHYEVALLDSRKVSRHLAEEARLREWLITRSCHNPFQ
jgi:hypothetical protein